MKLFNKATASLGLLMASSASAFASSYTPDGGNTSVTLGDGNELDPVWHQISGAISGTGGKIISACLAVFFVANMSTLGGLKTLLLAGSSLMIPQVPKFINGYTITI